MTAIEAIKLDEPTQSPMSIEDVLKQFPHVAVKWDEGMNRVEIIYNIEKNYYVTGATILDAFNNLKEWYVLGKVEAPK